MNWQEIENGFNDTVTPATGVVSTDLIREGEDGWLSSKLCAVYNYCEQIWAQVIGEIVDGCDRGREIKIFEHSKNAFFRWITYQIQFSGFNRFKNLLNALASYVQ